MCTLGVCGYPYELYSAATILVFDANYINIGETTAVEQSQAIDSQLPQTVDLKVLETPYETVDGVAESCDDNFDVQFCYGRLNCYQYDYQPTTDPGMVCCPRADLSTCTPGDDLVFCVVRSFARV